MPAADGVTFKCSIELTPGNLNVAYAVRNERGVDIGLFNRIPAIGPDGALMFPPDSVYVDIEAATLQLKKAVLPVPEGLRMSVRPVPFVTRLEPGAKFAEQFSLSLPVAANNPLRRAALAGESQGCEVVTDEPRKMEIALFSLGFFLSDPEFRFIPVSSEHPDVFRVWPPGPPVDRQETLSQFLRLPAPIEALDYRVVPRDQTQDG